MFINILNSDTLKLNIRWIIIRFCQMGGIILGQNCVQTLSDVKDLDKVKFSRADIVDITGVIKCSPILDYHCGIYYYEKARRETLSPSKINLFRVAKMILERTINYDFLNVRYFYSLSQLEPVMMDRTITVNWTFVVEEIFKKWESTGYKQGEEHLYFLCALLWPIFLDIKYSKPLQKIAFPIWPVVQDWKLQKYSTEDEEKINTVNEKLNFLIKKMERPVPSARYTLHNFENPFLNYFIEGSKMWNIDFVYKLWFFVTWFNYNTIEMLRSVLFLDKNEDKYLKFQEKDGLDDVDV